MNSTTSKLALLLLGVTLLAASPPQEEETIDSILQAEWKDREITPSKVCGNSEFLRRASLDIIGRIPTLGELKAFLRNPNRGKAIDRLLESPEYAKFWSELWTSILNGYSNSFDSNRAGLRIWLEKQFAKNRPFDKLTADLVTATGSSAGDGPVSFIVRNRSTAVKVSRVFLGVRIQCAQCHDHPFDRWTQEDYRNMTRFFQAVNFQYVTNGNVRVRDNVTRARGPKPRFLTGARPVTTQWRMELSLYMTRSKPFARNFANRMWYHLVGRGIVDPPDDFSEKNRPAVPALLDHLTKHAKKTKWDVKEMIRLICNSKAYQRSSVREEEDRESKKVFAYRVLKPLTPEQLYDSLRTALDLQGSAQNRNQFIAAFVARDPVADYTNSWKYRETVQHLMTKLTYNLRSPDAGLDEIYMRILSRKPTSRERKICKGRPKEDVVFSLCNSNEFFFNH